MCCSFGGHDLRLLALTGHTGADLAILDQSTGVLFAGDLVFYQRALTTPNSPGLAVWLADIDTLQALPWTWSCRAMARWPAMRNPSRRCATT